MIKDQCNNCSKYGTEQCGQSIVFNDYECESFAEKKTVITAHVEEFKGDADNVLSGSVLNERTYTAEYLKKNTQIEGWLTFFLFYLGLGGILSVVYSFSSFDPNQEFASLFDVVNGFLICGLSFYTIYSFITRKPDAVFLAKLYISVLFITNQLVFLFSGAEVTGQWLGNFAWSIIWFLFLFISEGIKTVIPPSYRKTSLKDYVIAGILILFPIIIFCEAFAHGTIDGNNTRQDYSESYFLGENDYTDGRIIFKVPEGYTCTKKEEGELTYYGLDSENNGNIIIASDYDTNTSEDNFNYYCKNWEDQEASQYDPYVICNEKRYINGNDYWYKVTRYDIEGAIVYWRFILLFDKNSGKVCVISAYDHTNDYLEDFLNSIRF